MGLQARTALVAVDGAILSSYNAAGSTAVKDRVELRPLAKRKAGRMTPDAAEALLALHEAVLAAGGDFRVTDALRDIAEQMALRLRYEAWLAAGKPTGDGYDAATMKNAFVARPGRSWHNAGRAIDVSIGALKFKGVKGDKILDKLWEIAIPLGWSPVIKSPLEEASEAWHFDFMGEWAPVKDRLGYEAAAMCACLDIGAFTAFPLARERAIQAHLHRAGFDVGDVDGLIGRRTVLGLQAAGIVDPSRQGQYDAVVKLPSASVARVVR